jgi:hypothetical protein
MPQRDEFARLRVCLHCYAMPFKRVFYLEDIFAKEEETTGWEIVVGAFHIPNGPGGSERNDCVIRQA